MTTFRTALTRLAGLSVTGVVHNYDIDAVPGALARAQLPALLVLPAATEGAPLARAAGEGFHAVAFAGGPRTVSYAVNHLLLVTPTGAGSGPAANLPLLIDLIDAYIAALAGDVTLNGALLEAARVAVAPGLYTHGGVSYHGCAFRHTWLMEV